MMACTKRSYRKKKKQPSCRPLLLRQNKSSIKASVNAALRTLFSVSLQAV